MTLRKKDFHKRSIDKVKKLWHLYILGENPTMLEKELNDLSDHLVMIGTGSHEFYQSKEAFLSGMSQDQMEARTIKFELQDEWYEVQDINETVCMVYGGIWAREKVLPGQTVFVDMQGSRFTILCQDTDNGVQVCSIHHSMPYMDQGSDEYYPKTLSTLAKELEQKVEVDRMTSFYSRYYMEKHVTDAIKDNDGYFFALDLDDFKHINDTKGHLMGDLVIIEFANSLRNIFSSSALFGRMGGDEFAVWDTQIASAIDAENRFNQLLKACEMITDKLNTQITCSAGIVFSHHETRDFSYIYQKADQALYQAKALGKKQLHWVDEDKE